MKKGTMDSERVVVAHDQVSEVSEPGVSASRGVGGPLFGTP